MPDSPALSPHEPVVEFLDDVTDPGPPTGPPLRRRPGGLLAAGIVGAVLGIAVTAAGFLAGEPEPSPLELTYDSFPEELFGLKREDLQAHDGMAEIQARYQAQFEADLEAHRFAYGGDGAAVHYVGPNGDPGLELTVVNGLMPAALPNFKEWVQWPTEHMVDPVTIDGVRCTIGIWIFGEQGMEDVAVEVPTCVLTDESRNLSLRIVGQARNPRPEDFAFTVQDAADELLALHGRLIR